MKEIQRDVLATAALIVALLTTVVCNVGDLRSEAHSTATLTVNQCGYRAFASCQNCKYMSALACLHVKAMACVLLANIESEISERLA